MCSRKRRIGQVEEEQEEKEEEEEEGGLLPPLPGGTCRYLGTCGYPV